MQAFVTTPSSPAPAAPAQGLAPAPVHEQAALSSDALLCGRKAVNIVHNGALYRLQATRMGKLILTK